jgi:5-methylcytosine-specific restriction endonuclease McrA
MSYKKQKLDRIYDRTSGYCHICHKKLSRKNYACCGEHGAWEVDHSRPRANGGADHINNYFAACIPCNREKGKATTATARKWNEKQRAPLSRERRAEEKVKNGVAGALLGGACGAALGPAGAVIGGLIGAALGADQNPDRS